MKSVISSGLSTLILFISINLCAKEPDSGLLNINNTAYAYYSNGLTSSTFFKFKLGTPSSVTVIGTVQPNFFGVGDWANPAGVWKFYVAETFGTPAVFQVDTATGSVTSLGYITGILPGHSITLMEWDHTTNKFFIVSATSSYSSCQLYSLDWSTKALTTIGGLNTTSPGITLGGFNRTGVLYVIDCISDNIYRISKTTGIATLVGPAGFITSPADGGAFDRSDWKFYCANSSILRQLDSNFNGGTLIGAFPYSQISAMCIVSFPLTSINQISSEIPVSFSLSQNYPNPFNPSTNIRYQIKENAIVTLKIYDILGKEIAILVNEKQSPGTYEVTWDARHGGSSTFPSEVYFYRLNVVDFTETKKMLLIK
jgi:hypothetical protein